mmetsp:Transcript_44698/g.127557  ORF Transcript_44698/g.127557 Transcript_44698/m.127557 type:complete len:238 (-) Transcript_44698:652-1365(-)
MGVAPPRGMGTRGGRWHAVHRPQGPVASLPQGPMSGRLPLGALGPVDRLLNKLRRWWPVHTFASRADTESWQGHALLGPHTGKPQLQHGPVPRQLPLGPVGAVGRLLSDMRRGNANPGARPALANAWRAGLRGLWKVRGELPHSSLPYRLPLGILARLEPVFGKLRWWHNHPGSPHHAASPERRQALPGQSLPQAHMQDAGMPCGLQVVGLGGVGPLQQELWWGPLHANAPRRGATP